MAVDTVRRDGASTRRVGRRIGAAALVVALASLFGAAAWPVLRPDPAARTSLFGDEAGAGPRPGTGIDTDTDAATPPPLPPPSDEAAPSPNIDPSTITVPTTTTPPPAPLAPPAPSPAPPAPGPTRDPGRVVVLGDSLTFVAVRPYGNGPGAPADVEVFAGFGWTAADAQGPLDAAVLARPVDTLVVALGTNDAAPSLGGDGWGPADAERLRRMVGTVADTACVVLVLPGHGAGLGTAHALEMAEARWDLEAIAAERSAGDWYGPTVVVDWQAVIDAHPALVAADGIHMVGPADGLADPDAAALRRDLLWSGVHACT